MFAQTAIPTSLILSVKPVTPRCIGKAQRKAGIVRELMGYETRQRTKRESRGPHTSRTLRCVGFSVTGLPPRSQSQFHWLVL
jgi:hypothetical protein